VSEASLKVRGPVVDAVTVSDGGRFMGGVGQHTAPGPSLESLRRDLDRIDECLLETLRARIDCCVQIAHVKQLIRDHLDRHPRLRAQRALLVTIPGIGETTAAVLIAELFDKPYTRARQAAAFAGLVPRIVESGTLRGRSRLSKIGPGRLRKALYLPAVAALRCNPTIRAVRARLQAAGKPPMVIIGAAMRKLIHLAFGVLKSGKAYQSTYAHS